MNFQLLVRMMTGASLIVISGALAVHAQTPAPRQHLIVGLQADGKTLDPHRASDAASMRLIENMSCGLLRYGVEYGKVEPDLANSYEVSDDGLIYRFELRRDAVFHTGKPIRAKDVRYSIERIRQLEVRANHFKLVDKIVTPDPYHVEFHMRQPFAPFLVFLANPMNAIVDQAVVKKHGHLDSHDAGCGPFQLKEWQRDYRFVLQRFTDYFRPARPKLDTLEMRPMPDAASRSIALRTGDIHLMLQVPLKDLRKLKASDDIKLISRPGTFWEYLGLQTETAPFDNPKVRQAIAWAIDRQQLNRIVKFGQAEPLTGGPIPSNHWAALDQAVYPQRDLTRTRKLLKDAGYPDGFQTTLRVGADFPYQVDAAIVIKQQLRDVGIQVTLKAEESSLFFHHLGRQEFAMTVVGWLGFVDPDEWFYQIFRSDGQWNQQGYANAKVDRLIDQGRRTINQSERRRIYQKLQRIISQDAPMIFLYANDQLAAYRQNVHGYRPHPTGTTLSLQTTHLVN
jgi:peptide/nickel transport system substrate-binding protein